MKTDLTLIDASGYIYRAFYALPMLTNVEGKPVNAVFGFCKMMMNLLERHEGNIAAIFDSAGKTFRHEMFPDYKGNRTKTDKTDLLNQIPLIQEACAAFEIPIVAQEGFEADDIIATYARAVKECGYDCLILSSDKDLLQLWQPPFVRIHCPMKDKEMGEAESMEKFGVPPHQIGEVLALMGDSSDNIAGAKGIGAKTAAGLIREFQTTENLLANVGMIDKERIRNIIQSEADMICLSRRLVTLQDKVPNLPHFLELERHAIDYSKLHGFFVDMGFFSLAEKIQEKIE